MIKHDAIDPKFIFIQERSGSIQERSRRQLD
jgi:hypothetical protein